MVGQKSGHYRKRNKSQSKKKEGGKGDQGKKVGGKGAAGSILYFIVYIIVLCKRWGG